MRLSIYGSLHVRCTICMDFIVYYDVLLTWSPFILQRECLSWPNNCYSGTCQPRYAHYYPSQTSKESQGWHTLRAEDRMMTWWNNWLPMDSLHLNGLQRSVQPFISVGSCLHFIPERLSEASIGRTMFLTNVMHTMTHRSTLMGTLGSDTYGGGKRIH